MPDNIIEVRNASVRYRVYKSKRRSLREAVFRSLLRRDELIDVWALTEVSFCLPRGDSLGLIGDNGAGKSTLCLLISQIMSPTKGEVRVAGKVSALLSIGAGFQGDLTGRDNIYLNGAYLGFARSEIDQQYDAIVDFAELGEAIDLPVRTYSSGMRARLAFSIASAVQPEILLLDELMGVGDIKFRKKSIVRMKELIAASKGLVVVSHNMSTIRELCTRVVWLEKGRAVAEGPTEEIVKDYEERSG